MKRTSSILALLLTLLALAGCNEESDDGTGVDASTAQDASRG